MVYSGAKCFIKTGTAVRNIVDGLLGLPPIFYMQMIYLIKDEPEVNFLLVAIDNIQCMCSVGINECSNFVVIIFLYDFLQDIYVMFFADNA